MKENMKESGHTHLTNEVDGGLHVTQLIGLSIKETQNAAS